jgi:hypothetical protein
MATPATVACTPPWKVSAQIMVPSAAYHHQPRIRCRWSRWKQTRPHAAPASGAGFSPWLKTTAMTRMAPGATQETRSYCRVLADR